MIYRITYRFCERFLKKGDRTVDQMVQAARSGKQNQANYLLDRQLKALEKAFLQDGGLRERMTRARLQAREQQQKERGRF